LKLENIGFYTLEDERAKNACATSPLWRNELIITSRCNFKCPYCRGTDINGKNRDMTFEEIKQVVNFWASQNIQNVRLSGGEPTVHPDIIKIVQYIKSTCINIKHIAISTNGYSDIDLYETLIECGVNDYSISLDACCSSVGDMMSGGVKGSWSKVVENIKEISKLTYVTVGMVFSQENTKDMRDSIIFAHNLGVSDIRIISAAQWNDFSIFENLDLPEEVVAAHPILAYRLNNFSNGRNVRGLKPTDARKCGLILDDMIVKGEYHYPCVIKMREGCSPIGKITDTNVRGDREEYFKACDCYKDEICKKNCLDVCIDYNNKFLRYCIENQNAIQRLTPDSFTFERWSAGSVHDFGVEHFRYENMKMYREVLLDGLEGYCFGEELRCKPKENEVGLLYRKDDDFMWFHIRNNEFVELFC
jgi:MoaA/NifB/PqqE/SkfB family radical SAM enzyme